MAEEDCRPLQFFAMRVLCYLLSVEYAQGIFIIGSKKATAEPGTGLLQKGTGA